MATSIQMDFYTSGLPIVNEPTADEATTSTTNASTVDDEIVLMIRELLDSRIRPSVQEDGGDIEFVDFNHTTGLLRLTMQGSCRGCSSSAVTLKSGIENMMRHYIPEVKTVEQVLDEAEQVANDEFQKLERSLEGGESVTGKK